jgi:hypothetical protein
MGAVTPAKAGVQENPNSLDSGSRGCVVTLFTVINYFVL